MYLSRSQREGAAIAYIPEMYIPSVSDYIHAQVMEESSFEHADSRLWKPSKMFVPDNHQTPNLDEPDEMTLAPLSLTERVPDEFEVTSDSLRSCTEAPLPAMRVQALQATLDDANV